jgi:hypothetical protein
MKSWAGVDVELRPLLSSTLDWGEPSASRLGRLIRAICYWMGRRNGLDALQEERGTCHFAQNWIATARSISW